MSDLKKCKAYFFIGIQNHFIQFSNELREVIKDCLISYKGNQYSTPYRFACQRVKVCETNEAILEIYDKYECAARHQMVEGKHQIIIDQAHIKISRHEKRAGNESSWFADPRFIAYFIQNN